MGYMEEIKTMKYRCVQNWCRKDAEYVVAPGCMALCRRHAVAHMIKAGADGDIIRLVDASQGVLRILTLENIARGLGNKKRDSMWSMLQA